MTVYSQYDYRYRNVIAPEPPRSPQRVVIFAAIGCVILGCACLGLVGGIQLATGQPGSALSAFFAPATPTRNPNTPVALKTPAIGTSGVEATVAAFQRPLKVEGAPKIPANEQFVLVTVRLRNTRTTGSAVKVTPADFAMTGEGGLTYQANPKIVTIKNLLTEANVEPGKQVEVELIFQIATDDAGLKLIWTSGSVKRTITLEP